MIPSAGIALAVFAVASLVLTIFSPWSIRIDLAVQVAMAAVLIVTLLGLFVARSSAQAGTDVVASQSLRPAELTAQLRVCEEKFENGTTEGARNLSKALKALREAIQYSISSAGGVAGSDDYRDLAQQVEKLSSDLVAASLPLSEIEGYCTKTEALRSRVGLVSSRLKARHA
jgi:hypothetical protein